MQAEACIREWTRRLLLERGYERNSVEGFVHSRDFEVFYRWVGKGYTEATESEFREEAGNDLEAHYLDWRDTQGRAANRNGSADYAHERDYKSRVREQVVRIPLDWLPEPQRREAERYLQYLQSKTRESVDAYLNALARAVGGKESDGLEYLLGLLRASPCIRGYRVQGDIDTIAVEECRRDLMKHPEGFLSDEKKTYKGLSVSLVMCCGFFQA